MDTKDIKTVKRKQARSGAVDYADAVVLHDTRRTRVTLVPFFIKHTEHTELSIKITTYAKKPPPDQWVVVEEKSLTLSGDATRKLRSTLQDYAAVAGEHEGGRYILIRVDEGTADLGAHDPATITAALTKVLSHEDIRSHLRDADLSSELANALRGAIRVREMQTAVAQLREYLEGGDNDERIYQSWCEQHTWAFGNAYVMRDEVRDISTGDQLDLLLPTVIAGSRHRRTKASGHASAAV